MAQCVKVPQEGGFAELFFCSQGDDAASEVQGPHDGSLVQSIHLARPGEREVRLYHPHSWRERLVPSFLRMCELIRTVPLCRKFFASTEDLHTLRIWHDWAVAKRSYLMACTGVLSILLMMVEQELVFDHKTFRYKVMTLVPSILKGVGSFLTMILLYQLYDLYDYLHAGLKKEWYVALYTNSGDNGKPLPRGILGES